MYQKVEVVHSISKDKENLDSERKVTLEHNTNSIFSEVQYIKSQFDKWMIAVGKLRSLSIPI